MSGVSAPNRPSPPPPPAGDGRLLTALVGAAAVVVLAAATVLGGSDSPEPRDESTDMGAVVRITSEPSGSEVWLGDQALGQTQMEVQLPRDTTYAVALRRPGYRTRTVLLTPGAAAHVVLSRVHDRGGP